MKLPGEVVPDRVAAVGRPGTADGDLVDVGEVPLGAVRVERPDEGGVAVEVGLAGGGVVEEGPVVPVGVARGGVVDWAVVGDELESV